MREMNCLQKHYGIGLAFFPYQLAFGISFRYFDCKIMFRFYFGFIKIWGYVG